LLVPLKSEDAAAALLRRSGESRGAGYGPCTAMGRAWCPPNHHFHSQTGTHGHTQSPQWVKRMRWQEITIYYSPTSAFFSAGQAPTRASVTVSQLQLQPRAENGAGAPCTETSWMSSVELQHKPACFHHQKRG